MRFTYRLGSHRAANTLRLGFKHRLASAVSEQTAVSCENHTKGINTLYEKKPEFCMYVLISVFRHVSWNPKYCVWYTEK